MKYIQTDLSTGTLEVDIAQDINPLDYFDIAERQNPKRSFLFVSQILGKHIPVSPERMADSYQKLAAQIPKDLQQPVLFIGMAETAVGLAAGIHRAYQMQGGKAILSVSTRYDIAGEIFCEFKEEHSHATDHMVYLPDNLDVRRDFLHAKTIVLVDDEVTTGKTFCHLIQSLQVAGLTDISQIYTVTLTDWCQSDLSKIVNIPLTPVSLVSGQWRWHANEQAHLPALPKAHSGATKQVAISASQNWGRLGFCQHEVLLKMPRDIENTKTCLILGTGEFLWQPFLLAEKIAKMGVQTWVSSTSRSPVKSGLAIRNKFEFQDNYGSAMQHYCYNIFPELYERIFICCETPCDSIDPVLLDSLQKAEIISYDI